LVLQQKQPLPMSQPAIDASSHQHRQDNHSPPPHCPIVGNNTQTRPQFARCTHILPRVDQNVPSTHLRLLPRLVNLLSVPSFMGMEEGGDRGLAERSVQYTRRGGGKNSN
jgi:hypothetical protein